MLSLWVSACNIKHVGKYDLFGYTGMGEPLKNYTHVVKAIRRIQSSLGMGGRRITVSTVGVAPRIRMLADEDLQVSLDCDYNTC